MALPADLDRIAKETEEIEKQIAAEQEASRRAAVGPTGPAPAPEGATGATGSTEPQGPTGQPGPDDVPPKTVDWEHKYKVLKGKYDKEVPRYAENLRVAQDQILVLQQENATLRAAPKPDATPATPQPATPTDSDLDNDPEVQFLKTEYPEVWKAVKKVQNKSLADATSKIDALTKKLEATTTRVETSDRDKFYDHLDATVEGWETVNQDPEFKNWLATNSERYSGVRYSDLMKQAVDRLDARTVASLFEDFAKSKSAAAPAPSPAPKPKPAAKPGPVYPPKPRPTPPPPRADEGPLYTAADIDQFYKDVRRGVYEGREAEFRAEEARIHKAVAEGRVA